MCALKHSERSGSCKYRYTVQSRVRLSPDGLGKCELTLSLLKIRPAASPASIGRDLSMNPPPIVFLDVNGVLQPFSKELCGGKVTNGHAFSSLALAQVTLRSRFVGECMQQKV